MEKEIYSPIKVVTLEKFKIAKYVIINSAPEQDVVIYIDRWAENSGLLDFKGYSKRRIGWDFPYVSEEQKTKLGLRGYVAAYIIPEEFIPKCDGAELTYIETDTYVTLTITDPHKDSFKNIPKAFEMLIEYSKTSSWENRLAFEEEYDNNGVHYMDIFVPMN